MTTERDEAVRVLRAYRGLVSDSKDSPKRTADLNGFDLAIATLTAQRGEVAPLDASMPERIWLQLDTDANNDERDMPFAGDLADLSWCAEQIGGLEVEYVRADLATPPATQQPEAQAVARLVIVDRGGGFKAIRTWDDIGDLPPGEHFLFSAAHPTGDQAAREGGDVVALMDKFRALVAAHDGEFAFVDGVKLCLRELEAAIAGCQTEGRELPKYFVEYSECEKAAYMRGIAVGENIASRDPVFAALDSVVPGWREHGSDTASAAATVITELSARATSNGSRPFRWDDDEGETPSA